MMHKPLKLLMIFRSKPGRQIGGAEKSMFRLINALSNQNQAKITVIFWKCEIQGFSELLKNSNIETYKINNIITLYRYIKEESPQVIYLFSRLHAFIWACVSRLANVPAIIVAERGASDSHVDFLSTRLNQKVVDGFICNSKYASLRLERAGVPPRKIFVVYNGIDSVEGNTNPSSNLITRETQYVVTVANIQPVKGIVFLLKAIKELQKKHPCLKAVLVGKDYTNGEFFQEVSNLGLDDTYIWVGYASNIKEYISGSAVFALPSLSEGMPTSILEAMRLAKPVVATNVGGVSELIEDEVTGLLVPPKDPHLLAEAIDRIIDSKDLANKLVQNASTRLEKNHSMRQMLQGHLDAFSSLLEKQQKL